MCDLPPSGSQPATDLGDFNPRYTRRGGGGILGFLGEGYSLQWCTNEDAGCVEQPGVNSHLCVKELSNQMWPFTIMDHKTKRNRHNTHVSDSILLRICVCFPCRCLVKELFHSALIKKKNNKTLEDLRVKSCVRRSWPQPDVGSCQTRSRPHLHLTSASVAPAGICRESPICIHARGARRIKHSRDNSTCRAGEETPRYSSTERRSE